MLCKGDDKVLDKILMSQTAEWRVHQQTHVLLSKPQGSTDLAASVHDGCSESSVSRVVARYREGGLDHALYDRPRSGRPQTVEAEDEF